ncbi:MAG: DUF799 domain-containing protein [Prevotellaceae bacterium]|jgi:hypothetical protein|nr:DUF799 domain-containing protein [Prevotellaceae bacterium]
MKKILYALLCAAILSSCAVTPLTRGTAYPKMYEERPLAIAVMPPINKTNNVESKEFLYITLPQSLCERGYYVLSPFLSMELFKSESAYDAEMFEESPLAKFQEILGADAVLFTTIHSWEKNALLSTVTVSIEYKLRSTKTNETIFHRKGTMVYDASVKVSGGGLAGALVGMAASAISTAATDYVKVASACNSAALVDLPEGKYSPNYDKDKALRVEPKEFKKSVK